MTEDRVPYGLGRHASGRTRALRQHADNKRLVLSALYGKVFCRTILLRPE